MDGDLLRDLDEIRARGLHRSLRVVERRDGPRLVIGGRALLSFCSNDYLGLADHPATSAAAREAVERFGWGSGASRLVSGTMRPHAALEEALASFKGTEAAVLFPTGYMTNLGVIAALAGPGDEVIADRLDHASIIDGCRLSGARLRVYPHGDVERLERVLAAARGARRRLIVTDTLFSMDGDLAPLREIVALARRHGAWVMADEAHATGVLGAAGRGGAELLGVEDGIDVSMGTLSKALGGSGGFVAGSAVLADYLRNRARPLIYTTAPPPASCAAALAAIGIVRREPGTRAALLGMADRLRRALGAIGLDTMGSGFQIVPVRTGDAGAAVRASAELLRRGILVPAIRPPTVPRGESRLRISVTAAHTDADVDLLAGALAELAAAGVLGREGGG
ncbi:MAG: 8-amino-7-oxononanoate synthase [bacterium]|nr:8-amino-7-oxononanoate synthase [bacterium]